MKPAKSITEQLAQNAPVAERPKPLDTLIAITEQAIAFGIVDRVLSLVRYRAHNDCREFLLLRLQMI